MKLKSKLLCFALVTTVTFSNCKKNEISQADGLINNQNAQAYAGDKKYHVLGQGYDVTGRLASSTSARLPVLDVEKYITDNPGLYLPNDDVEDYYEYSYGENVESYSRKLNQKYKATLDLGLLKNVRLFKGEINASFTKKDSASSKYVYATIRKMIKQKTMRIFFSAENLRNNYLTDQFKSDLINLPAEELVKQYGTHVLTDIELGARLDMNYEAQTNNTKREEAATAGANITAWKIFNVTADIATNNVDASSNFNQTLYYSSVGGDGTKGLIGELALDNTTLKINVGNWQSSCTKDNAALIKIGQDGLLPLEDLISDPVKKQQVKVAIENYILNNQIKMTTEVDAPANGTLMRNESTGQVYIVMDRKLRYIQNQNILYGLFEFKESMLNHYSAAQMATFPMGTPISPSNGLVNNNPSGVVYFRELNVLRRIPNMTVKERYHFNWNIIQNVNSIAGYTIGADMSL